jgi:hypothetical protein
MTFEELRQMVEALNEKVHELELAVFYQGSVKPTSGNERTMERRRVLVLDALRKAGHNGQSRSDIRGLLSCGLPASAIDALLEDLRDTGKAFSRKGPSNGGRRKEVWFIASATPMGVS